MAHWQGGSNCGDLKAVAPGSLLARQARPPEKLREGPANSPEASSPFSEQLWDTVCGQSRAFGPAVGILDLPLSGSGRGHLDTASAPIPGVKPCCPPVGAMLRQPPRGAWLSLGDSHPVPARDQCSRGLRWFERSGFSSLATSGTHHTVRAGLRFLGAGAWCSAACLHQAVFQQHFQAAQLFICIRKLVAVGCAFACSLSQVHVM